jgi:hypothetical protein
LTVSIPFPSWELAFATVVRSAFLPVGYLWCETEFKLSENTCSEPMRIRLMSNLVHTRSMEQFVGLLAFVVLTIWNLILIFDLRSIPSAASFPDAEGTPIGIAAAGLGYLVSAFIVGWLPWLAVCRGLPALYGNNFATIDRSIRTAAEDSNG